VKNNLLAGAVALAACAPVLALAQDAKTVSPKASPQLTYQSAFADYKPYQDAPPGNWRALNELVSGGTGDAAGHAGHGMGGMKGWEKPAAASAPATSAPSNSMPMKHMKPMPMHGGHPQGGKP
jgi:hypothetical protein